MDFNSACDIPWKREKQQNKQRRHSLTVLPLIYLMVQRKEDQKRS